ncbi:MAG TPA: Hsp20 family protein [Gemmatimonadaceae bacterium]
MATNQRNAQDTQQSGTNQPGNDATSRAATSAADNAPAKGSSTSQSPPRGDQQRTVPIDREKTRTTGSAGPSAARDRDITEDWQHYNSPFSFMRRFGEDMDRLFADFGFAPLGDPFAPFGGAPSGTTIRSLGAGTPRSARGNTSIARRDGGAAQRTSWLPEVEVLQRGDDLVIRADLPGVKREDVTVEVDDGILTLSGSRQYESEEDRDGFYHSERSYGSFSRSIPLPRDVEASQCNARFDNGVLEVTIPVPKESKRSKRVDIR